MIPFYIFYSMFGFQRTGDSIWAMADQLARGFLIGATAGRTTLTGEGLQHADGHSPLLAATNPAVVHYDPAFAYEVAHIMESGLARMYGETEAHPHGEDVIFYITVYNEPVSQPKEPDDVDVEGILRGMHQVATAEGEGPRVTLLASGVGYPWIEDAQRILAEDWGVAGRPVVGHLLERAGPQRHRRRGVEPPAPGRDARGRRTSPTGSPASPARSSRCRTTCAPYPSRSRAGCPADYRVLGADGFGFADTRPAARRFFHIDAQSVVVQALQALADAGEIDRGQVEKAFAQYRIDDPTAVADVKQEGGDA